MSPGLCDLAGNAWEWTDEQEGASDTRSAAETVVLPPATLRVLASLGPP